jgi:threonylcarbamoyladenosine tRNA methylthiotransferase CDKAL1
MSEGVTEIWLTSEDTGAYGRDLGIRLPLLLKGIVHILESAFKQQGKCVMLRIGMTNPPYILEDLEEIADILNHHLVYKFLHLPVQRYYTFCGMQD